MDRLPVNLPINGRASARAEILHGPERRRRWSAEDKARIVAESFEPGVGASAVAARHGLHRNQLYAWRRELRDDGTGLNSSAEAFAPVVVVPEVPRTGAAIEIALGGSVVRVGPGADLAVLGEVLRLLKRLG